MTFFHMITGTAYRLESTPPPPVILGPTYSAEAGSLYFTPGLTSYVEVAPSADWAFADNDNWTIEWYQWMLAGSSFPRVFSMGSYPSASIAVSIEGSTLYFWGPGVIIANPISNFIDSWNHFAICKSSGITRVFQNGVEINNWNDSVAYGSDSLPLYIGQESLLSLGSNFNGFITNFRWTKGAALYTSNFTPSTKPLAIDVNTKLLLLANTDVTKVVDAAGLHSPVATSITWTTIGPFSLRMNLDAGNPASYTDPSSIWNDLTTYGNSGSLSSATYNSDVGGYLTFGPGGSVYVENNPAIQNQNRPPSAAITMWINLQPSAEFSFVAGLRYSLNFEFYFLTLDQSSQTEARVGTPNGYFDINANFSAYYNSWTHVCFTVNNTISSLFINGTQVGSNSTIIGTWGSTVPNFMVGKQSDGSNPCNNLKMSQIKYHTRARTADEVLAEFNAEKARYGL